MSKESGVSNEKGVSAEQTVISIEQGVKELNKRTYLKRSEGSQLKQGTTWTNTQQTNISKGSDINKASYLSWTKSKRSHLIVKGLKQIKGQ